MRWRGAVWENKDFKSDLLEHYESVGREAPFWYRRLQPAMRGMMRSECLEQLEQGRQAAPPEQQVF